MTGAIDDPAPRPARNGVDRRGASSTLGSTRQDQADRKTIAMEMVLPMWKPVGSNKPMMVKLNR